MIKTHITTIILLLCFTLSLTAQEKLTKVAKTIDVTKDVTIDLNTSYVQIEVDTWTKNTLEIEAYIEGEKLSKEELKEALKDWNLKIEGSGSHVFISSEGGFNGSWDSYGNIQVLGLESLESLEALETLEVLGDINFADMPEIPEMPEMPEIPEIAKLELPEMPQLPELPELPEGVNNVSFDTEAYKKDGEAYLEKWSKEYEIMYGAAYKEKMKTWARAMAKVDFSSYEKSMEAWGEKFGKKFGKDYEKKMEAWGDEFAKRFDEEWSKKMEAWGERYSKQMEERTKRLEEREKRLQERSGEVSKRQEELAKRMEERQAALENRRASLAKHLEKRGSNVKKIIKIKMPKNAKLKMNVRHGELKMTSVIHNLKANISHATLVANHIDGSETSINVSYSPVDIQLWSLGELNLKYVENAKINTVERLVLNSNSSDILLNNLTHSAIIDGSFGDLTISNIANTFQNLNIILENSEAVITLPKTDYSVYFKGNRSRLNNEMTTQKTIENYTNSQNLGKTIVLNAKFSDVILKN